jgi:tight adherence protein C
VISAHGRITGWILACLPPSLAFIFAMINREHMQLLWTDPLGLKLLYGAIFLQVTGMLIIKQIIKHRVLREADMSLELTLAAVFISVALASGALSPLVLTRNTAGPRRLRTLTDAGPAGLIVDRAGAALTPSLAPAMQRLARFIPTSPKDMSRVQKRMAGAGYHGLGPAVAFTAIRSACRRARRRRAAADPWPLKLVMAVLMGMLGYIIPGFVLSRLVAKRQKSSRTVFLTRWICSSCALEAGSSLDQAVLKTSQDLGRPVPAARRGAADDHDRDAARQTALEAVQEFRRPHRGRRRAVRSSTCSCRPDRFGTSIALALRTHADTSRTKRRQRARTRARRSASSWCFPLAFCLFRLLRCQARFGPFVKFVAFLFRKLVTPSNRQQKELAMDCLHCGFCRIVSSRPSVGFHCCDPLALGGSQQPK